MGRFINRDPIGENGGLNPYGFVQNNPVNRIDLLGMSDPADYTGKEMEEDVVKLEEFNVVEAPYVDPFDEKNWGSPEVPAPPEIPGLGEPEFPESMRAPVMMERFVVTEQRYQGPSITINAPGSVSVSNPGIPDIGDPKPVNIPLRCSDLADSLLNNLAKAGSSSTTEVGKASAKDREQFYKYMRNLNKKGGTLGTSLVLGWAGAGSRTIRWDVNDISGGGSNVHSVLGLVPGDKYFSSSRHSEFPKDPVVALGHELGHAVVGINGNMMPSPYKSPLTDVGMEAANVSYVENTLRGSFSETARGAYGGESISDIMGKNGMPAYSQKAQKTVNDFIDKMRRDFNCL